MTIPPLTGIEFLWKRLKSTGALRIFSAGSAQAKTPCEDRAESPF
jgi:hypothetical protein